MVGCMKEQHGGSIVSRVSRSPLDPRTMALSATLLKPGTRAPEFRLAASDGRTVQSTDYLGRKSVVIFFYPKADTFGCTIESCAFRDVYEDFAAAGAEVIGISADPVKSHDRFREKYSLPFILASDADRATARAYGVPTGLLGLPGRATFVVDKRGIVRDAFSSRLRVKRHVSRALGIVRELGHELE
jgi:thioredoxin-dependent peroxiredoxin